jgi:hypothetical protein
VSMINVHNVHDERKKRAEISANFGMAVISFAI